MTVLGAVLDAIGSLVPGAVPRRRLRFPLREVDQAQLTDATVKDGGAAHPDWLVLDLEVDLTVTGAAPPEVLPLFPGWLTFTADDPDPAKAIPDPEDAAFDWTARAGWPTQGRIHVDLDQPALEKLMSDRGAAFPVVPTRASYWPVVLPAEWLTEASVKAMAERKAVARTDLPAVPRGAATWAQHVLAAFLAGGHRLRVGEPPDDDARDTFELPTLPLAADGTGTLTMALARPVETPDDGATAEIAAAAAGAEPGDPDHPLNQPVPVRRVLQALRDELGTAGLLSAEVTAEWPVGPRWFTLAVGTPGEPATPPYALGALAEQSVEVREGAALLQQRPLPLHGAVSIAQHAGGAPPEPAPPTVAVTFPAGPLHVSRTNVADPADASRLLADLAAEPQPWAALMPALPGGRAALVSRSAAITTSRRTRAAVTAHLLDYARRIRPVGWNGNPAAGPAFDEIFHGSRTPSNSIGPRSFERLFDAMDLIGFADPAAPVTVRRPSHALLLWLMEGMVAERADNLLRGGWMTFADLNMGGLLRYTAAERTAATPAQIRTSVRVALFWNYFGLDINNWQLHKGPDNLPFLGSPIADSIAGHDGAWRSANDAIVAAGVIPPPRADVNATIRARQHPLFPGVWQFRLEPGFGAAMLACQYAEYLRRLLELPAAAQPYASFAYAAYNGNPVTVTNLFAPADAELAADPAKWRGKDHEDVLMSRRLLGAEVTRGSPPPQRQRSVNPKVQTLHVAALSDAWARHLPGAW